MKIIYKPFAIIAGIIAARIGQTLFKSLWGRIDEEDPPGPSTPDAALPKVVGARTLEAATMAAVGATVERASMRSFQYLTGIWPGDKPDESDD